MKLVRVGMMIGRTVNIGNYESLRMDVSAEVAVDSGENLATSLDTMQNRLSAELDTRCKAEVKKLRS